MILAWYNCHGALMSNFLIRGSLKLYWVGSCFVGSRSVSQIEQTYRVFSFLPVSVPPALYEKADIKAPEDGINKHLIIGVSSDRGLCGAIHSNVAKAIKAEIAKLAASGKEVMVVNVGDKLRNILHRY